ncbi:hypothetical protein ABB37_00079 [Leptomonas pyrrhocoris]|uniref:CCHC-type domain-containing protein n=1 Tax=Leptomonas pyrrhocoris TaxID=157538 RepID=A0A0N0DZV2_LEPPY|nr:hypothetical protein ABB37_09902 [Leptomonas pyrrhocoris]XP_015664144.1 hypothetical protein ABB37_00079 [Leptomonas pyrrhocoris]KPA73343.1 hypothetical protein ABB37_09902 [Leptomonas pyrrhocoris]KPA85705.1 hypothetical protein ABB37_00079 [Leptomonas pyrrhocoris]|eukprot:XP_015651782.1 hypothetical protein ABB37_09902 [Leptomonas pyrrhocoris]
MDVCTWRPWFRGKTPYEIEKQLKHIFLRGEAPRTAPVNDAFQAVLRWLLAAEADPRYWADHQGTGRRMGLTLFYRVNGSSYKMTETEFLQACEENSYNFDPLLKVLRLSGKKDAYKTTGSSAPASSVVCYNCGKTGHKSAICPQPSRYRKGEPKAIMERPMSRTSSSGTKNGRAGSAV